MYADLGPRRPEIGPFGLPTTFGERISAALRARALAVNTIEGPTSVGEAYIRQRVAGSRSDVPLGAPVVTGNAQQPTSAGLSQVVTGTTGLSTGSVYGLLGPSRRVQTTPNQTLLPAQSTTETQTMDLGNIITQLGSAYITARYGQPMGSAPRPIMAQPVGMPAVGDVYGIEPTPAALPMLPLALGAGAKITSSAGKIATAIAGLGLGLSAPEIAAIAEKASKVKCRRKRRRLATHSDIKDLAALKSVLGSGKAFDTWIATRRM